MVKKIFGKCFIYFALFLMYLPILLLVVFSFIPSDQIGVWTTPSFKLYFDLFKNCYKKLNSTGIALAIAFSILGGIACNFHPVLSLFLSLGLNLITYSANTVWYVQRVGK